jgi:hypothetical protein
MRFRYVRAKFFNDLTVLFLPTVPLRLMVLPAGFIAPCLPIAAPKPPSGGLWLHEIKHDDISAFLSSQGSRPLARRRCSELGVNSALAR